MGFEVLDPTYGDGAADFERAPRSGDLRGATVGIISNGKHGTKPFFESLGRELRERHGVAEVEYLTKPNYSAPAGDEIFDQARHWQALVAGIGD